MECRDDVDDDALEVSGTNASADAPTTTPNKRKYKTPKYKRTFNRSLLSSRSKKHRNSDTRAAAGAGATDENSLPPAATAAVATPSPANRSHEQLPLAIQMQVLQKKAAGFFDDCASLQDQLKQQKAACDQLEQENVQLQQKIIDQQNEVKELKDSHRVQIEKQNKLYRTQQQRYKSMLSSTVDVAKDKYESADEKMSDALKIARDAQLDKIRVIGKERESSALAIQRVREKHRKDKLDQLMFLAKCATNTKDATTDERRINYEEDEAMDSQTERERELEARVSELEAKVNTVQQHKPKVIQKNWIRNKNGKRGGAGAWPHHVVVLILEWLSNRTPPSCIAANMLSMTKSIMPSADIVVQLPTTRYIQTLRSVLVVVTKTLAAYTVANLPEIAQAYTDATNRRQTEISNVVIGYRTDAGLQTVTLNNMILAVDKTSLSTCQALLKAMESAQQLLQGWIDETREMFPDDDVVNLIPLPEEATFLKLRNGFLTTDTCNQARKLRKEMIKAIKQLAVDKGLVENTDEFVMFELDCWNHLRNIWIEHAVNDLEKHLKTFLAEDLAEIPSIYRVDVDMNHILRGTEKEFALTANYFKGDGGLFLHWMNLYHPGALLFPLARMLGGTRQDAVTEGSLPVYMNRHFYLEFLHQGCVLELLKGTFYIQVSSLCYLPSRS